MHLILDFVIKSLEVEVVRPSVKAATFALPQRILGTTPPLLIAAAGILLSQSPKFAWPDV